jgi:hypothetical protein
MAVSLPGLLPSSITGSLVFLFSSSSSKEEMTFQCVRNAAAGGCR